ncbi:hypothetical protein [Halobacteriovorax sp. HLS]|uniref:hypothetical protein n=1 Tax=Halobacteriovorax sp. HLS TaxID=2234000 RepID=UPI000FDC7BA6|nr:hypothetical protein [Halobacteriovorax sp. HLS]
MKIFLIVFILISSSSLAQSVIKKEDHKKLESKKAVIYQEKVKGNVWPRVRVNILIDSSPLEALAIFLALDHQKNYLPNLIKSTPVKHISATEVHTAYELELPWPLPNSKYTNGSDFKKISENKYMARWYLVESDSAYSVDGNVYFTRYNNGMTLMQYQTLISPKSALSGIVRGFMIKDTTDSIIAIRDEVERVRKEDQSILKKYISYIQRSLSGEKVYEVR